MFVRKKKNPNNFFTIQVVDKSSGFYRVIKNFGVAKTINQKEQYIKEANEWIKQRQGILEIDYDEIDKQVLQFFNNIQSLQRSGPDLVLGRIFDEIGFNKIKDPIFKQLVLYRLIYPGSKLKTTEYLYRYHQIHWDEDKVYRYLDKLHNKQQQFVQQISYDHTIQILHATPQVVFYDVTTIYFEIEREDELRQTGFSKEGKHQNPQIVLGLLVSKNGYPLAYDIFQGKQFEGHTLLPVIEKFASTYHLQKLIVVADAGLLSNQNIDLLVQHQYEFIIGARIKNESRELQQQILAKQYQTGSTHIFARTDATRLIVSYSDKRAAKDAMNRARGLKRLENQLSKGRLTKNNINNKGYNKYLKLTGNITLSIDYEKYKADEKWDGLKGYLTNSKLSTDDIIANYNHLWQIEKAFRISKTDLKIRPIYHRLPRRIAAHICLNFVAYKVYKELERQLEMVQSPLKARKVIEIAESIFQIEVQLPTSKRKIKRTLLLNNEQKLLAQILNLKI